MVNDTATLKEGAYRLFAHRTFQNISIFDDPNGTPISYIRFYDSNGDYIQVPVMRSYDDDTAPIFDDTGGTEADPVYTSTTQYYHDLNLVAEIPRFTKTFDVDAYTWGYSAASFAVVDYKLFNQGGVEIAAAADSTTGMTIAEGQRYTVRFKIRVFNDMVEQTIGENTRTIITKEGLKTILRRVLMNNSPQENARAPTFIGVGVEGAYYISNGSDGRWYYDDSSASYTSVTSGIFPPTSAADDYFLFCREETVDDDLEGIEFVISNEDTVEIAATSSLVWEYYNTSSAWVPLFGVHDATEQFRYSGIVRWEVPTDIATDAEIKSGTVGRYYRCKLVGGGFNVEPTVATPSTDITPLVLRTVQSETDLQLPMNRKSPDLIATPATGRAAKVSAVFGPGGIVERTRSDDGTLLSRGYEPIREVGLFTAPGITERETIDLGEVTGVTVTSNVVNIPNTNPEPIKLINVIKSDGTVYDVGDRIVEFTESGGNYVTTVPLPDGTYDITYLGRDITPSITPQNILSVEGNVQNLRGPDSAWFWASEKNPVDSDTGADTAITPRTIMVNGVPIGGGGDEGPLSPVFTSNSSDRGIVTSAADWGLAKMTSNKLKRGLLGDKGFFATVSEVLNVDMAGPFDKFELKFTTGYPMVMARFNVQNMYQLHDPVFVVSANGFVKWPEEAKFYYHVMIWSEGDPTAKEAHKRETGWKLVGTSTPVAGKSGVPANVTLQLPMNYRDNEDYTSSPYVDKTGDLYLLIITSDKTKGDKKWVESNAQIPTWEADRANKTLRKWKKRAKQAFGDLGVNYIGMFSSPVGDASKGSFSFRRGVDWTYYLNDAAAAWRITGASGGDPENYPVLTSDGTTYLPVLPTARIGQDTEMYKFGALPALEDNVKLYLQHQPLGSGGIYVWLEGEETRIDNFNGGITVNGVGWDSDGTWNNIDPAYSDDHDESSSGGDGYGYVDVSFDSKDWGASEHRNVGVRYLYYDAPKLDMTYLYAEGKMFARAHCSDVSHNTPLNPTRGDRVRIYFEVQFEEKRS